MASPTVSFFHNNRVGLTDGINFSFYVTAMAFTHGFPQGFIVAMEYGGPYQKS